MMQVIRRTLSIGILVGIAQLRPPFFPQVWLAVRVTWSWTQYEACKWKQHCRRSSQEMGKNWVLMPSPWLLGQEVLLCCAWSLSHVRLFATLWTVAHQALLSMGILQARILEWVAMPSSRGSSLTSYWTQVFLTVCRFFTIWATREAQEYWSG